MMSPMTHLQHDSKPSEKPEDYLYISFTYLLHLYRWPVARRSLGIGSCGCTGLDGKNQPAVRDARGEKVPTIAGDQSLQQAGTVEINEAIGGYHWLSSSWWL